MKATADDKGEAYPYGQPGQGVLPGGGSNGDRGAGGQHYGCLITGELKELEQVPGIGYKDEHGGTTREASAQVGVTLLVLILPADAGIPEAIFAARQAACAKMELEGIHDPIAQACQE